MAIQVYRAHEPNPAKAWMMEYRRLLRTRDALLDELDRVREGSTRATSRLTATRVSGMPTRDGVANAAVRTLDCEEQLRALVDNLDKALQARVDAIAALTDGRCRELMTYRYVCGWGWERIAATMNYDLRWLLRLHGEALQQVKTHIP